MTQEKYAGRIVLILVVLFVALLAIFWPPMNLFRSGLSLGQRLNLKPGIDMKGGTSLIYEIRPPEGVYDADLAEKVMQALKKRVDPHGVKNLVWRPQGSRLEIQMPLTTESATAEARRKAFEQAKEQLKATNVRPADVLRAVQGGGADRERRLVELAMGSPTRTKLFGELMVTWDQLKAAEAARNAERQAELEVHYEALKQKIDATNINISELEQALADTGRLGEAMARQKRQERINALKAAPTNADFPRRIEALDAFADAWGKSRQMEGQIGGAADLKRMLRGSGVLTFHILVDSPPAEMVQRLKEKGPVVQAGDTGRWYEVDRPDEFQGYGGLTERNGKYYLLCWTTDDKAMLHRKEAGGATWALKSAREGPDDKGQPAVHFEFDGRGAVLFGQLTTKNVGKQLAIVLDEKLMSAPNINTPIVGGSGYITGGRSGFSRAEINYLVNTLNAGSLPAQLDSEPISERTVGPQLGEDNLRRGLWACIIGLVVVVVFMCGYYYLSGLVASIAVLLNVVLILGVMAAFDATFTLPSIAAIALTVGASVDANVLIFERLREERHRGLPIGMAIRNAYDRAFSAILDSNVTTLITSVILYALGTDEVKGFGLTLLIGLLASLFTALFVTRTLFMVLLDKFNLQKLSSLPITFPRWEKLLHPKIDWIGKAWLFITISTVLTVVGVGAFVAKWRQGELLDIEFASGTQVQFELKQPMRIEAVRKLVETSDSRRLPSPSVYSVGDEQRVYEVATPNDKAAEVKAALFESLKDHLKIEVGSQFASSKASLNDAEAAGLVAPIRNDKQVIGGFTPPSLASHIDGVAIILKDLDPRLSPREVKAKIGRERQQGGPFSAVLVNREFDVEADGPDDAAASTVVVMISDVNLPFSKDPSKWRSELAAPLWNLVRGAIDRPAEFQKVNNFDPAIAGETAQSALLALVLSLAVIMAYIWLRFGNLKYGTATVLAMVHDTVLVIGLIGISHYLSGTAVGNALLLEPFRLNLTLVAAILTVMGYSMLDTIVVFDRVRENRGKFGHLSRQVINDSINQTLPRTLLTGGTTLVTLFVMYVSGGPGIHGFTFAMLTGILIGTYSSIAIACPLLLVGAARERRAGAVAPQSASPARV